MKTKEEIEKFDMQAMGCKGAELIAAFPPFISNQMATMSILSDAQELLEQGAEQNAERVRQYINRAKYLILNPLNNTASFPRKTEGN